jgi:FKBP-type peptidyl-prolyl cis-trans isomerase SlyD
MAEVKVVKNDFVEIEFLGKNLTSGEVFDTNIAAEAKKINPQMQVKPLIVCVGKEMLVKGFDEDLAGKEVGKKYTVKITPDNGFGKRDSKLIRMIPLNMFHAQKIQPQPGMTLTLDNNIVKVIAVSGGRVMTDFNNPLAGKDLEYEYTIKRKVEDMKTKANALQNFFFGNEFEIDVDDANKKIVFQDVKLMPVINAFASKFKEFLGYDAEIFQKAGKDSKKA